MSDTLKLMLYLFIALLPLSTGTSWASFNIQSEVAVHLEIREYNGLVEIPLYQRNLTAETDQNVNTSYTGLALLIFPKGQSYPVIIGKKPFLIIISSPDTLPSFTDSPENEYFYQLLQNTATGETHYDFPDLMIQAKQLLDSTRTTRTIEDLNAKKEEFHKFVSTHYEDLEHSDMIRRLVAQYFMMHEYVDYQIPGAPATDIRIQYQKVVLDGVSDWLQTLKPHIPDHEIINYIVSLYYNRSMVSMASLIMNRFQNFAYCPGTKDTEINFPQNLKITDARTKSKRILRDIPGNKLITFVSDECPVSMVAGVVQARRAAHNKNGSTVIVAPLQELTDKHLSMSRMISGGNLMFVDDEEWRQENLQNTMRLPRFISIYEQQPDAISQ